MKFEHILFPVDLSERTMLLKSEVESLAQRFGSKVTVLHVFEIPATWYGTADAPSINMECFQVFADSARESLKNFKLDLPAGSVDKLLAEGDPAWQIAKWAREHAVDLIMMGTRGCGRLQGLLLGSVAAKVIHNAQCPVWTEGGLASQNSINQILCAVDIDGETLPLLRFADEVSRLFSAKLQLVHCIPEAGIRPGKYFDFDLRRYLPEGARIELAKLQRAAGTHFETSIVSGNIAKRIRELALQNIAGLVVLGKGKNQHPFGRLRTHAYQIIHDAPCPVLSYCPAPPSHTSSSYSEERLSQSAEAVPPPIGSSPP
jgi:nucleotide-binding universal stress UspA family protein